MPLQATSGAASYDAFGGGVPVVPNYIEDVFSSYLWTGNDSSQTITNGIDLAGKGGLVWIKSRNQTYSHILSDTNRGTGKFLSSNTTDAQGTDAQDVTAFNTTGFTVGNNSRVNNSSFNYASWTFRKQPKFFDVVTYTGTFSNLAVNHNLGSVPGMIIVKSVTGPSIWSVYHRSLGATKYLRLNQTTGETTSSTPWNNTAPTSTQFTVGSDYDTNDSDVTYVAYIFAHDAGGFGLTGTDNVISCGSFTTDGAGDASVNLGYEPQWVMQKRTDSSTGGNWFIADNMRGMTVDGSLGLFPNLSNAEDTSLQGPVRTNATGFTASRFANATYIYIAIRRGPMKVPTSGTSVFSQTLTSSNANPLTITTNFPVDMTINRYTGESSNYVFDRLRGANASASGTTATYLKTEATSAENTIGTIGDNMQSNTTLIDRSLLAGTSDPKIYYSFRRAPSFFDVVCWTAGSSTNRQITHNLTVAPELIFCKSRNNAQNWAGYVAPLGINKGIVLNSTGAAFSATDLWGTSAPTSTTFSMDETYYFPSGYTVVSYLFATCAGVSKVGSYTGNGSSQTINCGFTGGARFVLIKKTSGTGDWMVSDSARGIVSGSDPYLELNNTNAEVTGEDWLDTDSTGFVVNEVSGSNANTNGATYIFLAIA